MNRTALVTGATGFLGAFFVALLLRKGVRVNALIRNASERSLLPTINNIGSLQADIPKDLRAGFSSFEGNVRDTDCGLSDTDLDRIIPETTDIWHFAAAFEERSNERGDVYATNVGGTDNLLNLLCRFDRFPRLNYVSTAYAAPVSDNIAYEHLSSPDDQKGNVYEQTKAEAERRVVAFCEANGIEFRIFRPPIVAGESSSGLSLGQTGYQGVFRALYLLKRRLEINLGENFDHDLRLRVIADPDLRVNVVPVDFVVDAMWHIAELDQSAHGIFNVTGAHGVELSRLFEVASDSLKVSGIKLSTEHDFEALPITMAERLFRRRMKFQEPYFLRSSEFDTSNFRQFVAGSRLPSPTCDTSYLNRCNQFSLEGMEQEFSGNLNAAQF